MLAILVDIRLFVLCINYESLLIYPFQLGANMNNNCIFDFGNVE